MHYSFPPFFLCSGSRELAGAVKLHLLLPPHTPGFILFVFLVLNTVSQVHAFLLHFLDHLPWTHPNLLSNNPWTSHLFSLNLFPPSFLCISWYLSFPLSSKLCKLGIIFFCSSSPVAVLQLYKNWPIVSILPGQVLICFLLISWLDYVYCLTPQIPSLSLPLQLHSPYCCQNFPCLQSEHIIPSFAILPLATSFISHQTPCLNLQDCTILLHPISQLLFIFYCTIAHKLCSFNAVHLT